MHTEFFEDLELNVIRLGYENLRSHVKLYEQGDNVVAVRGDAAILINPFAYIYPAAAAPAGACTKYLVSGQIMIYSSLLFFVRRGDEDDITSAHLMKFGHCT